jgi:hypothetical protein
MQNRDGSSNMLGTRARVVAVPTLLALALLVGCGSRGGGGAGGSDPGKFSANVDNPWFPLKPGTTYVYEGTKDGKKARDLYTVTHGTKTIDGAPTRVVSDLLFLNDRLAERTTDYYSQDTSGNVWYFGEDTAELDSHGKVKTREGTWHAGENGAKPGIFMEPRPAVGQSHRQELYKGHAEDHYAVIGTNASIRVPAGRFIHAVLTKEWTPLEPKVLDHKYYAKGVGQVAEKSVRGPKEALVLTQRPGG